MRKYYPVMICAAFSLLLCALYAWRLPQSFIVDSDFGRDLDEMARIIQGHITLIGPPLSFGGIFTAPYYYYLFVPALKLSRMNVDAVLYVNAFMYAAAGGYVLFLTRKIGWLKAIIFTSCICLNPLTILLARHPGNGYTYIAFFIVYMAQLLFTEIKRSSTVLLMGVMAAGMITFHPISAIPLLALSYVVYRKSGLRRFLLWYVLPIVISFLPLAIFEAKHGFITIKALFIDKSYASFMTNTSTVYDVSGKKNLIDNIVFLSGQLQTVLVLHPFLLVIAGLYVWPLRSKMRQADWFIYVSAVGSFLLLAAVLRFRYQQHYLYIFGLFLLIAALYLIVRFGRYAVILLSTVLIIELAYFPLRLYADSTRPYSRFETAVRSTLHTRLVRKHDALNVFSITDKYIYVPAGHEYRFFLRKYGYEPKSEYEYADSDVLLIFSEDATVDIRKLTNWEIDQFGTQYLSAAIRHKVGSITVYVIRKTPLL